MYVYDRSCCLFVFVFSPTPIFTSTNPTPFLLSPGLQQRPINPDNGKHGRRDRLSLFRVGVLLGRCRVHGDTNSRRGVLVYSLAGRRNTEATDRGGGRRRVTGCPSDAPRAFLPINYRSRADSLRERGKLATTFLRRFLRHRRACESTCGVCGRVAVRKMERRGTKFFRRKGSGLQCEAEGVCLLTQAVIQAGGRGSPV